MLDVVLSLLYSISWQLFAPISDGEDSKDDSENGKDDNSNGADNEKGEKKTSEGGGGSSESAQQVKKILIISHEEIPDSRRDAIRKQLQTDLTL